MSSYFSITMGFAIGVLGCTLCGCGSDNGNSVPAPTPSPPSSSPPPPPPVTSGAINVNGGYFAGEVVVDANAGVEVDIYAEALITRDGLVRMYFTGPTRRAQFAGSVELNTNGASTGSGLLIGEDCIDGGAAPLCGGGIPASVSLTQKSNNFELGDHTLEGEIKFEAESGEETRWQFSMVWPTSTYVDEGANLRFAAATYVETNTLFAEEGMVISVDQEGRVFFQSSRTGCVGNGILAPHGDRTVNVYDADILIEGCNSAVSQLNGRLVGLATRSDGPDWGEWLVLWLSSSAGVEAPIAMTMWGAMR